MSGEAVALSSLKDVAGVEGSFVISPQGTMVARDMSALFIDDLLDEIGARLLRLIESFSDDGAQVLSVVLRYREHLVFVRPTMGQAALCVLSDPRVNVPALRMGASLVLRHLGSAVAAASPSRTATSPAQPARPPAPSGEPPGGSVIQYRGSVVPRTR